MCPLAQRKQSQYPLETIYYGWVPTCLVMEIATTTGSFELCEKTHIGTLKFANGSVNYSLLMCRSVIFCVFGRPTLVVEQQTVSMMGVLT